MLAQPGGSSGALSHELLRLADGLLSQRIGLASGSNQHFYKVAYFT